MNLNNPDKFLRIGLIVAGLLVLIVGGIYVALNFVNPAPPPELPLPVLVTPKPTPTKPLDTPTPLALATPDPTSSPTATATPTTAATSATPALPVGAIVYALSPDVNSVGWVQAGEQGNHFGDSFLYAGMRDGILYHGAMQFDLSFIPDGATIFMAELDLTGLVDDGLTEDSVFEVNILAEEIDTDWSRHDFEAIHQAVIDETLTPIFEVADLGESTLNTLEFNAAQRSIIETRLETSNALSFRLDSLNPDRPGWFGWDSGFGNQTSGHGPILRVGVIPPVATEVAVDEIAEAGTPTPTPTFVVVTSVPTPENLQTAAAIAPRLTLEATTTGTPTPLPQNWVTPLVVTETPTPENTATALFRQAEATAAVIAFGTSTPTPINMVVATPPATPTATRIFIPLEGELPPVTPAPIPTYTPKFMPSELIGKIAFKSNRPGSEPDSIYVINPDGSGLALLTHCWPYHLAVQADTYSADGRFRVFTKDTVRYKKTEAADGSNAQASPENFPALFWYDAFYKQEEQLSNFGAGIAYGGVWSPTNEQIAFISTESQNDEIWVVNRDGSGLLQLTRDEYAWWDKHPSWSPDGTQIVFYSNRTGHKQIFVMNVDGSNLYSLSRTGFDDYDPVWIKYQGIPTFNPDSEDGQPSYIGSFGLCGPDVNCSAFATPAEAQAFFLSEAGGGPFSDPHGLDADRDGLACENPTATTP